LALKIDPQEEESMNIGELFIKVIFQQGQVVFDREGEGIVSSYY